MPAGSVPLLPDYRQRQGATSSFTNSLAKPSTQTTESEAIGYGTWDGHHQQYNLIPMPTGPALARLPYWIAVQDNADGGGTAEPYTIDAQDQFLRLNGIKP